MISPSFIVHKSLKNQLKKKIHFSRCLLLLGLMWSNRLGLLVCKFSHKNFNNIIIIIRIITIISIIIITKGEEGETFYFIEEGQARVMISRGDGEESQQVIVMFCGVIFCRVMSCHVSDVMILRGDGEESQQVILMSNGVMSCFVMI